MYSVNKNINHDGKIYSAGQAIKEGDPGFKELLKAGHLSSGAKKQEAPQVAPVEQIAELLEEAEELFEAAPKSKKGKGK